MMSVITGHGTSFINFLTPSQRKLYKVFKIGFCQFLALCMPGFKGLYSLNEAKAASFIHARAFKKDDKPLDCTSLCYLFVPKNRRIKEVQ